MLQGCKLDPCRKNQRAWQAWALRFIAEDSGAETLPAVPVIEAISHLTVATKEEVGRHYSRPEVFWELDWQSKEKISEQYLLTRGMKTICGPDYYRIILPQHWQLARAAKPGLTEYYYPQFLSGEQEIFLEGVSVLEPVGYIESEKTVEYSCAMLSGQQIPAWEFMKLFVMVKDRELEDGSPIEVVRVVFLEQWAAEQEKRPLLDIGCKVFYYTDQGTLEEITD